MGDEKMETLNHSFKKHTEKGSRDKMVAKDLNR